MDNSILPITSIQQHELSTTIVPISNVNEVHCVTLINSTNSTNSFLQNIIARFQQRDVIVVYAIVIVVWLLFFLSYIPGIYSQWFLSLQQPRVNVWIPRIAWVVGAIISYIGFYILARNISLDHYLAVTMLYVGGSLLLVGWSVALYQAQNIALASWVAGILFVYQAALFLLVWYLNPIAGIFMIPMLALYLYLVYNTVQLAQLNNVLL